MAESATKIPTRSLQLLDNTGGRPLKTKAVARAIANVLGDELRRRMAIAKQAQS